ncbi:class I SAM-dependent methyltransferase [Thermomonospora umbrina]|uniref:Methyltransferase family protein n=1 Tax=Thermomonospora umbrina TaxID=111806 RepID=A0A3D9SXP4_9ACTN|nr:class I SAM-dependent methyltransferase [Thermomonospora umbrina]REE97775.1 hypothetical protein DFJ69_3250 [Thermomonospora umbrina]
MTTDAWAGAAHYSRAELSIYDVSVLAVNCRVLWRCPPGVMLAQYDRNVSDDHLELGPGTGYFLDRCSFPSAEPRLTLIDLDLGVLRTAGRRLARHSPTTRLRNVLEPLRLGDERFGSVGLNMLLHCVPGSIADKAVVFDHLLPYLRVGGRVFGSTVLCHGVPHTPLSRAAVRALNRRRIFHNAEDSLDTLEAELDRRFTAHRVTVRGSMALFEATR